MSCRAFYNEDKAKDLYEDVKSPQELSQFGKKIDDDTTENFEVILQKIIFTKKYFQKIKIYRCVYRPS